MLVKAGVSAIRAHTWAWPVLLFEGGGDVYFYPESLVNSTCGHLLVSKQSWVGALIHRNVFSAVEGQDVDRSCPFLGLWTAMLPMSSCDCSCLSVCIQVSPSHNISQVGLGSTLVTSFWLYHLLKDSMFTYSHCYGPNMSVPHRLMLNPGPGAGSAVWRGNECVRKWGLGKRIRPLRCWLWRSYLVIIPYSHSSIPPDVVGASRCRLNDTSSKQREWNLEPLPQLLCSWQPCAFGLSVLWEMHDG